MHTRPRSRAVLAMLLGLVLSTLPACTGGGEPAPAPPGPGRPVGPSTTMFGAAEPADTSFADPAPTTLGVRFTSTLPGLVTGVRFYKGPGNTGTHVGALWDAQGRQLARVAFTGESDVGWQQAKFAQPVRIAAGTTYTAGYLAPSGHYAAAPNAFDGGPVTTGSGPLTAVGGGFAGGGTLAFPAQSHENTDYYVDVSFSPTESASHVPGAFTPGYWSKWPATARWKDPARLPVGVWMQDPTTPLNGSDEAHAFAALGVNTLVGLWDWPEEDHGQVAAAAAAKLAVVAGGQACDPTPGGPAGASAWACGTADLPLAARAARLGGGALAGYQLADEPDMNVPDGTATGAGCMPPGKLGDFAASLHGQDATRPVLVNFGSGVAGGARSPGCPTDFAAYTASADIVSVDFYGLTDPSSPARSKGVRVYAATAARARKLAPGKPVWVFLETPVQMQGASLTPSGAKAASPAQVRAAAWAALVNGATGLSWFCHSFVAQGQQVDACLRDAASAAAMRTVNADAQAYAPYWNAPPVLVGVTTQGAPVTATLRTAGGRTAVLAVATDTPELPGGGPATATFTLPDHWTGKVRTDDGRTLTTTDGTFTDHFDAYQPHVYTLGG
ncbi:DUF4082 domain-containing protein [Kitasatospora sp. NPDC056138]|uniref:DUF4082 domain-containing protein n=1 Tax=Kitasatospora sp. NPDC056138 TaxID=3345724 RepID=UPI0035D9F6DB